MRIFALALTVAFASRAGAAPVDKPEYVGQWAGHGTELGISAEGSVSYKRKDGALTKSLDGMWSGIEGNVLKLNVMITTLQLRIDEPPHQEQGVWVMTVNGAKVLRTAATPTRASSSSRRKQRIEAGIRNDFTQKGVAVVAIVCPAEAETAALFACALTTDLHPAPFPVRVVINDQQMDFRAPDVALLAVPKLRGAVAGNILGRVNDKAEVTCPTKGTTIAEKVGSSFVCTAKGALHNYTVKITVTTVEGNVSFDY